MVLALASYIRLSRGRVSFGVLNDDVSSSLVDRTSLFSFCDTFADRCSNTPSTGRLGLDQRSDSSCCGMIVLSDHVDDCVADGMMVYVVSIVTSFRRDELVGVVCLTLPSRLFSSPTSDTPPTSITPSTVTVLFLSGMSRFSF